MFARCEACRSFTCLALPLHLAVQFIFSSRSSWFVSRLGNKRWLCVRDNDMMRHLPYVRIIVWAHVSASGVRATRIFFNWTSKNGVESRMAEKWNYVRVSNDKCTVVHFFLLPILFCHQRKVGKKTEFAISLDQSQVCSLKKTSRWLTCGKLLTGH